MDGLLFDTEKVFQETWNELAVEITGHRLPPDFKYQICGTSGERSFQVVRQYFGVSDGKSVAYECYGRVRKKLALSVDKKNGCDEILSMFRRRGVKMAVASSSEISQIQSNLRIAGIENYFDAVVSGFNIAHGKPAPDIFLLAAEKLALAPEECYVFEDAVSGIEAGHAAGMSAIMIPDLLQPDDQVKALCTAVFPNLHEASVYIDALFEKQM